MILVALAGLAGTAFAQNNGSLAANQTYGFGAGKLLKFTYTEIFDCIDQPDSDLNFNGIKARSDPAEMQIPICQAGSRPTINPPSQTGNPAITTEPLYVLVPIFSVDNDTNPNDTISCDNVISGTLCGPTLGSTLISLFGSLPERFKAKPMALPSTCTMHASRLDLGPALVQLGLLPPPPANVSLPTPNPSHVIINPDINIQAIWWQVIPVLVFNQSDWPQENGSSGITSEHALRVAEEARDRRPKYRRISSCSSVPRPQIPATSIPQCTKARGRKVRRPASPSSFCTMKLHPLYLVCPESGFCNVMSCFAWHSTAGSNVATPTRCSFDA